MKRKSMDFFCCQYEFTNFVIMNLGAENYAANLKFVQI